MTNPEAQRRPGGRSARVRRAVLEATRSALNESGMAGVNVADIAARAEVHETSIYRRWGTREHLMIAALLDEAEELLPVPDTGSLRRDLTDYLTSLVNYLSSPPGIALDRALASAGDEPEISQVRNQYWDTRYEHAGQIFTRAIRRGELPKTTDTRLALEMAVSPLHFRVVMTRERLSPTLVNHLVETLVTGLTAVSPGSSAPGSS